MFRKLIILAAAVSLLGLGGFPAVGQESLENLMKLNQASARLTTEYLKQTIDDKTGLWVPPRSYTRYKSTPTGEYVEVPGYKVVGYRDIWRWVKSPTKEDPYHKVYKKVKHPIMEKTGEMVKRAVRKTTSEIAYEDHFFPRWIEGMNALGVYALLAAGEPPDSVPLERVLQWLKEMAELGLPDTTYELSIMMMVFLRWDPNGCEDIIDRGISKLLYGQINKGPGRGQWGQYCVNWRLLALMKIQSAKIERYKHKMKGVPAKKDFVSMSAGQRAAYNKKLELDGAISWLNRRMKEISREFTLGRFWWQLRREEVQGELAKKRYYWPKGMYDAREMRLGDLQNTEFALMALAEAYKQGWFKKETQKRLAKRRTLVLRRVGAKLTPPAPPNIKTVVARTAAMLQKYRKEDGCWDTCTTKIETTNPYEEMRTEKKKGSKPDKPAKKKGALHKIEPADPLLLGTASAMHSLALISEIVGKETVGRKYGKTIDSGKAAYEKFLKAYVEDPESIPTNQHVFLPYRFWITVPSIKDNFGFESIGKDEETVLLKTIIKKQNSDGTFGRPLPRKYHTSSIPPPSFPDEAEELWAERNVVHHPSLYPRINPKFINSALALIFYSRYMKKDIQGPQEWPDVFEYFCDKREKLFEIEPSVPESEGEESVLPDKKTEPPKEDETF